MQNHDVMDDQGLALPEQLEERLDSHLLRAAELLDEARAVEEAQASEGANSVLSEASMQRVLTGRGTNLEAWIASLGPHDAVALAVGAAEEYARREESFTVVSRCVKLLRDRVPPLEADDVRLLLAFDELPNIAHYARVEVVGLALDRIERMLAEGLPQAERLADEAASRLAQWNPLRMVNFEMGFRSDVGRLVDRARWLAGRSPIDASPSRKEAAPIHPVDGFGVAAIEQLGGHPTAWPPGVRELLDHATGVKQAAPSARWTSMARQLIAQTPGAESTVRELLQLMVTAPAIRFTSDHEQADVLLRGSQYQGGSDELVRGLVWLTTMLEGSWRVSALEQVAKRCIELSKGRTIRTTPVSGEKVQFACFQVLGLLEEDAAAPALVRLLQVAPNPMTRNKVTRALEQQAARMRVEVEDLIESSILSLDLDRSGGVIRSFAQEDLRFQLDPTGKVSVRRVGDESASARPRVKLDKEARAFKAELEKAATTERSRQEELLRAPREMELSSFISRYVEHPLSGWFANRLIWRVNSATSGSFLGIPVGRGSTFRTPGGEVTVDETAIVGLWHPVLSGDSVVAELRDLTRAASLVQPFRQAWRETFHIESPDDAKELYTSRFAGVIVHGMQLDAIGRTRRWRGTYLNTWWDGGQESVGFKTFDRWGVRVNLALSAVELQDWVPKSTLAVLDRIWFTAGTSDSGDVLPLGKVPTVVFSEALRDVSLFVAAAAVSNDPLWLERGGNSTETRHLLARTLEVAGGAVARRLEVLDVALPLLLDVSQYQLLGSELKVLGSLRSYLVDLTSGAARVEESGTWLSFGPQVERQISKERLVPTFVAAADDDAVLQKILGRAVLLASDVRIKSDELKAQILR